MKNILITSSVLILAILLLRLLFRRSVSRRAIYALWALVLVRLLVPVSLPAIHYNVLSAAAPIEAKLADRLAPEETPASTAENTPEQTPSEQEQLTPVEGSDATDAQSMNTGTGTAAIEPLSPEVPAASTQTGSLDPGTLLTALWLFGGAVMAILLFAANLRFWRRLRSARIPYPVPECPYPVFLVEEGLPSPCLFGLFCPAIYLTPAAVATPQTLRHVLAHELTHARQRDPLWSLLRNLCLVIYWFDPLVWAAAIVSRIDCELACDEAALRRLGADERIAYGRTLISLIPVQNRPVNPLLSATTMASGKRQLKERITRIAENRKTAAAALLAVGALAFAVIMFTFTAAGSRSLTEAELAEFNRSFSSEEGFNIRAQFLTSLYDSPEEIDLYELFYNGTGLGETASAEEEAALEAQGIALEVDLDKLSTAGINQVLKTYTGLTLPETQGNGVKSWQYLSEFDSYYHLHGDTNAQADPCFAAGERDGDTIRLYYNATGRYLNGSFVTGWACLTLEAQKDGSYHIVSHQLCDAPAIPTDYPEGTPWLTISLADAESYQAPEPLPVGEIPAETGEVEQFARCPDEQLVVLYSTGGAPWAAVTEDSGQETSFILPGTAFAAFPEGVSADQITLTPFAGVLGQSGVILSYPETGEDGAAQVHDYYAMDGRMPQLLARVYGTAQEIDLDGNGVSELTFASDQTAGFLFLRDGQLYQADISALLQDAWPELSSLDQETWSPEGRCLRIQGLVSMADWGDGAEAWFTRDIYFDEDSLRIYRPDGTTADHLSSLISDELDPAVIAAGKDRAQSAYLAAQEAAQSGGIYDDWRVSGLTLVGRESAGDDSVEVYQLSYEFHSPQPGSVLWSGGSYVNEDGWVGGLDSDESPYLVFLLDADGKRVLLESRIPAQCEVDSPAYEAGLCRTLLTSGAVAPDVFTGRQLALMFYFSPAEFLNELSAFTPAQQSGILETLAQYRADSADFAFRVDEPMAALQEDPSQLTLAGRALYEQLSDLLSGGSSGGSNPVSTAPVLTEESLTMLRQSAQYDSRPLSLRMSQTSYDALHNWLIGAADRPSEDSFWTGFTPLGYLDNQSDLIACWGRWDSGGLGLYLLLPDGSFGALPLPQEADGTSALPQSMRFEGAGLIYEISFTDDAVSPQYRHVAGTYRYEVDTQNDTVSLRIITPEEADSPEIG
jgi:beta-lactamase regulating signal transducer with metallopeptidase domain